jgi:arsenate reductase (glutaredoxin)
MTTMIFFEKPGCVNGEKQKAILIAAGHTLQCTNILFYPWTKDELLPFVEGKKPETIMNSTAPAVKKGEIDPAGLSFAEAVTLMLKDPILIKRPLIKVDGLCIQGFYDQRSVPYLGPWEGKEDVITCPRLTTLSCDEQLKK